MTRGTSAGSGEQSSAELLDWLENFHGAALMAYVEIAREQGSPPESEAVRRRAYAIYEAELAKKNANRAD